MKFVIFLCLVGLAVAQDPSLTAQADALLGRVQKIVGTLQRYKTVGVQQIGTLATVINANSDCLDGISAPNVPETPADAVPEPASTVYDQAGAQAAIAGLTTRVAALEGRISQMGHVGRTHIDIFQRFLEISGQSFCGSSDED